VNSKADLQNSFSHRDRLVSNLRFLRDFAILRFGDFEIFFKSEALFESRNWLVLLQPV